jgi:hypothetical protein
MRLVYDMAAKIGHMVRFVDDVDAAVPLPIDVGPMISLVPSLTGALAFSCPEKLVAATDWYTHPADLVVAGVRGTKNSEATRGERR